MHRYVVDRASQELCADGLGQGSVGSKLSSHPEIKTPENPGQGDHLDVRKPASDLDDRLEALATRHRQVGHDHVNGRRGDTSNASSPSPACKTS